MTRVELTREQLYEMVWQKPMVHVAMELGMSGRGLAKRCIRLEIPFPGRGYWRKLEQGYKAKKVKLKKSSGSYQNKLLFNQSDKRASLNHHPLVQRVLKEELKKRWRISVPARIQHYHPLVKNTLDSLLAGKWTNNNLCTAIGNSISITCTKTVAYRAAAILNALLMGLKKRKFKVAIHSHKTYILCHNEVIQFSMREKCRQVRIHNSGAFSNKVQYIPTGLLALKIEGHYTAYFKRNWIDNPKAVLEEQLNDFIVALAKAAVAQQIAREQREAQNKQWEAEKIQKELVRQRELEEQNRIEHFHKIAAHWRENQHMKAYLKYIESSSTQIVDGSLSKEEWLVWARQYLNRLTFRGR